MEKKITYSYDSQANQLNVFVDGKLRGGFIGNIAANRFTELLDSGAEIKLTNVNTETVRKRKVQTIRIIWKKLGIDDWRIDYLTEYGVSSTSKLNIEQLDELINRFDPFGRHGGRKVEVAPEIRKLWSGILCLINKLGIYATNNDWSRVNQFMRSEKIAGKLLFEIKTVKELEQLRKKLNSILYKREVSKAEIERLTINN